MDSVFKFIPWDRTLVAKMWRKSWKLTLSHLVWPKSRCSLWCPTESHNGRFSFFEERNIQREFTLFILRYCFSDCLRLDHGSDRPLWSSVR